MRLKKYLIYVNIKSGLFTKTKGRVMFKVFKHGRASAELKKYMAHWMRTMSITFREALAGSYIDQVALNRISVVIIGSAISEAHASSTRVMTCLAEVAVSSGVTEEDLSYLPYQILAVLKGVNDRTPLESKKGMLWQISPGYEFSDQEAEWFDTNIEIIVKLLKTELCDVVDILQA
jgi:hypothetical protein